MVQKNANISLFVLCILLLNLIGLIFIYSSSSFFALEKFGYAHYFVKKQLFGMIIGIISMFFCAHVPLPLLKKLTPFLFIASLIITLGTLVPPFAVQINGSYRWL